MSLGTAETKEMAASWTGTGCFAVGHSHKLIVIFSLM
jgi:hypothetical protein